MGAPEYGRVPRAPSCTDWRSWFGGSPLRAAGGQPCWNAWPDQTRLLQSLQKTKTSPRGGLALFSYLISTLAPASSSFFLIASASALLVPSFTGFGAPSTRSLASFRPRLVTSRTALMVFTLFSPAAVRMTVNSVFSSAAAAAPPPAAGGATATAAAGETPDLSSMPLMG